MPPIYQPAEDSYLMLKILEKEIPKLLEKNPNLKFLEIGSGSGILLKTAEKIGIKKSNIFASDINKDAVRHCKNLGFNCICSDLFESFKGRLTVKGNLVPLQFDLIVFNPPYLPKNKHDKGRDTTGGKKGSEVINKFLKQAKKYLKKDGKIFLLTSSLTKNINWQNYCKKLLTREKLFFEELGVWELVR